MNRKEFVINLGKGVALITFAGCLDSCSKNDPTSPNPPQNVDFSLDLTASENSALNSVGGYVYRSGVIVANLGSNIFAAVSQACTHQGFTLIYQQSNNRFHCNNHGSNFSTSGSVINGPATNSLKKYNAQLNGNVLHVFS
jgi:cytochrome b6-f complex iron-sulfur subunit